MESQFAENVAPLMVPIGCRLLRPSKLITVCAATGRGRTARIDRKINEIEEYVNFLDIKLSFSATPGERARISYRGRPRKGLASFGLTGISSELESCSCEALDKSLLPASIEVNYTVNNKERAGRATGSIALGTQEER